jgi:BMFP domain-containing protein YqiC
MVQTTNRFFDEVARLMNDAAGVAQGVRREAETLFRTQAERILRDLAVVQREEFEAVKDMARLAREENEALKARIAALEARLAGSNAAAGGPGATSAPPGPGGPQQPPAAISPKACLRQDDFIFAPSSRSSILFEHDLFEKPASTFPDHALAFPCFLDFAPL